MTTLLEGHYLALNASPCRRQTVARAAGPSCTIPAFKLGSDVSLATHRGFVSQYASGLNSLFKSRSTFKECRRRHMPSRCDSDNGNSPITSTEGEGISGEDRESNESEGLSSISASSINSTSSNSTSTQSRRIGKNDNGGYVYMMRQLDDVESLRDFLPDLQEYPNPLLTNKYFTPVKGFFASDTDLVAKEVQVDITDKDLGSYFRLGGPRERVLFSPDEVKAAIVTCGGLCPGLNTVIREIVFGLWFQYGVRDIVGIKGGYRGFYSDNTMQLTPKAVSDWHRRGGTMLGTTRGGHDTEKIVDSIEDRGINQVYIIGGDGTQRGAIKIHNEVVRRGIKVAVTGIPKTVDNDVAVIDKSFGFDTAVEAAQAAINAAHVEAESTPNGVGLVKVMGRYAGHIAMAATLASRDVDCCLIPEVPFYIDGPGGLFEFMEQRLRENGHCVILLAEGAGQELVAAAEAKRGSTMDASGNKLLLDTGLWLAHTLKDRWSKAKKRDQLSLKYIDPTYMVRAVPSNASDTIYCTLLAHTAIHGAMAGYTGFITGPVNGKYCYIPMQRVASSYNQVNVQDRTWAWVRSVNNQPDFVPINFDKQGKNEPTSKEPLYSKWVAPN